MSRKRFVASRDELLLAGFPSRRIDNWCTGRRLVQVLHGVYAYGRDIETREAALRAGLLACGRRAVLTGRSACEEWRLINLPGTIPQRIDVASGSGKATTHRGRSPAMSRTSVRVVHRELHPEDVRRLNGLTVVRPAWALIDLAVETTESELRFAFLEACRLGLFTRKDVKYCYEKIYGRRGAKLLRPLLSLWVPELNRIRSVYEGWFLLEWVERGYLMPLVNHKVHGREVDLYWPAQRMVLELDGGAFHSDPIQKSIDSRKQSFLESCGLSVSRLTYKEFARDPGGQVSRIAAQLRSI